MMYQVVLLDQDGKYLATEPMEATDHCEAQTAAATILELCKDVAHSYEVRFNDAIVARGARRRRLFDLSPIIEPRQINVLDVVERLRHGFTPVALSRRLRKATARLRRCGGGLATEARAEPSLNEIQVSPAPGNRQPVQ